MRLGDSVGIPVDTEERLTNIRYADDLMIYALSCSELCSMIELLCVELQKVGLHLNMDKTKIFTTDSLSTPLYLDVADGIVEVLRGSVAHKYLGRTLPGNLRLRGEVELSHRIQNAWAKFHKHRTTLTDRHVSVKSRLKLYEATVTPTVLYGLAACPLTERQRERLDVIQRRMLRSIVGWARSAAEDWSDTMRRMRDKVDRALRQFPCIPWSMRIAKHQQRLAAHIAKHCNSWAAKAVRWQPAATIPGAFRSRGRPLRRWNDTLTAFAR